MMLEGCKLSGGYSGCSFVRTTWNMNSFSIRRSWDIGQNAVAIFLLLEIYRRYWLRSGGRGNTPACILPACRNIARPLKKLLGFSITGCPMSMAIFIQGRRWSSLLLLLLLSPFPLLFFLQGNFYCGSTCAPETYSRIDENRVEITYS